jgi:hypothetical protein
MQNTGNDKHQDGKTTNDDTPLEKLAKKIDPPSREVSDGELRDPGSATPGAPPVDNRS